MPGFYDAAETCYKVLGLYPLVLEISSQTARIGISFLVSGVIVLSAAVGALLLACRQLQGGAMHRLWFYLSDFLSHVLYVPVLGTP